jgi:hypothetical protein
MLIPRGREMRITHFRAGERRALPGGYGGAKGSPESGGNF